MKNISKPFFGLLVIVLLIYLSTVAIENVLSRTQEPAGVSSTAETETEFQPDIISYTQRVGEKLFLNYCSVCHGEAGDGLGFNAYTLETKPRNFTAADYMNALSDERLSEAIREGGKGVNKSVLMPAWGNTFSQLEISYLVGYIRTFAVDDTIKSATFPPR